MDEAQLLRRAEADAPAGDREARPLDAVEIGLVDAAHEDGGAHGAAFRAR